MLNITNALLAYGSRVLFENACLQLYKGQKVGLVGKNGTGKTSFFKMLRGDILLDKGNYSLSNDCIIGYVEQEIYDDEQSIVDYVLNSHPLVVTDQFDLPEFYQLRPQVEKLLLDLGFKFDELIHKISHFSGGWQGRLKLAKALFIPSDLLLLDEPTNHLDLETVIWLEDWLKKYTGLAIIISHDREFLDNVTTHTMAINAKKLRLYSGNYSTYENTKFAELQLQQSVMVKNQAKRAHLKLFVDRFRAKATKAKQVQSRIKMLEKLQVHQAIEQDRGYQITFLEPEYCVNKLVAVHNAKIGYPENILLEHVTLDIFQESRVGILGRNGIGKSTLIKTLMHKLSILGGDIHIDAKVKVGYFSQHTVELLDANDTPLLYLMREHPLKKEKEVRAYLGNFGFMGDTVFQNIGVLSGGEKARLTIANIILHKPNLLFLDEPTNHLDMQMREELAVALQDFEGGVLIVSHDKFLLQSVADEYYLLHDHKVLRFDGDLEDYHKLLLEEDQMLEQQQKQEKKLMNKSKKKAAKGVVKNKISSDEATRLEIRIQEVLNSIGLLEQGMARYSFMHDGVSDPEYYELVKQCDEAKNELLKLEEEWLNLNK